MPLVIVPVSIVVLGILGFAHALVYEALITISAFLWPALLSWRVIVFLRIIFVLLALSFTLMTLVSFYSGNIVTKIVYRIAAVWTGFLMYFFFAAFGYGALVFFQVSLGVTHWSPVTPVVLAEIGLALFVIAALVGIYGVIHAGNTKVTNVSVKLSRFPESWKGKKAVWISDIHLGHVRGRKFLEKVVRKIETLKPDMVFIGGDLFDGPKIDADAAVEPLRKLCGRTNDGGATIPRGVYFVMGNHEEFSATAATRFLNAVKNIQGMRVLEDELVTVDGVDIIGVDHGHANMPEKFSEILERLKSVRSENRPSILLKHEPRDLDVAVKAGISFQISGHTHQGQVFPATLLAWLVFPGYNYGLHMRGDMQVYTSSGVGTWGPPLRVGTKSEIVLFEFQ